MTGGSFSQGNPPYGRFRTLTRISSLTTSHLVAQVLLGEPRSAHAVGLEEQRPLQRIGRQRLEVVGVVEVRRSVERAAGALHIAEVGELLQILRALEHQVLEQVREPGAPFRLGSDADVIDDGDTDHRCGPVRIQHHPQPIGQGEALDGIFRGGDAYATRHVIDPSASPTALNGRVG